MLSAIADALAEHGLILRGGFYPEDGESGVLTGVRTVLIVGNAGGAMWGEFEPHIDGQPHPLDRWTKRVIDPIATQFGAATVYPFGPGAPPFQRWALKADTVFQSPLGLLIHPEYGLWHAYRAALLFATRLPLPPPSNAQNPCATCAEQPCLQACPVGAFSGVSYDVEACAAHLAAPDSDCTARGCRARNACPVGASARYTDAQMRFHMAAFARSVGANEDRGAVV